MARLQAGNSRRHFPISCRKRDLSFLQSIRLSVDPRQPPIQWLVKVSSQWGKPIAAWTGSLSPIMFRVSERVEPYLHAPIRFYYVHMSSFAACRWSWAIRFKVYLRGESNHHSLEGKSGGPRGQSGRWWIDNLCPFQESNIHLFIFLYISLTVHLSITLANDQLDAQILIYLLQSSTCTCFEQYLAHPQEVKLY